MSSVTNSGNGYNPKPKKNKKGFFIIPNTFYERGSHLTPKATKALITLYSFRNSETGATFPSYKKIKERSGFSRNDDIAKSLDELENFGWLERNHRFNKSNVYRLTIPAVERPSKEEAAEWKKDHSRTRLATWKDDLAESKQRVEKYLDGESEWVTDDDLSEYKQGYEKYPDGEWDGSPPW